MVPSTKFRAPLVVVLLLAFSCLFAPMAEAGGGAIRVQLDEPFQVNGRTFSGGMLVVRTMGEYMPSATFQEVCVDGECLGQLLARENAAAGSVSDDSLIFERNADGVLVLVGVALRNEPTRDLYRFVETDGSGRWLAPLAERASAAGPLARLTASR